VSLDIKDAAAQFHNLSNQYHLSPQIGAFVTYNVFNLLYKILIETYEKAKAV
jgi:hypothetical protein